MEFIVTAPPMPAPGNPYGASYVNNVFLALLTTIREAQGDKNAVPLLASKVKEVMNYMKYGTYECETPGPHTVVTVGGTSCCAVATLPMVLAHAKNMVKGYIYGDGGEIHHKLIFHGDIVAAMIKGITISGSLDQQQGRSQVTLDHRSYNIPMKN